MGVGCHQEAGGWVVGAVGGGGGKRGAPVGGGWSRVQRPTAAAAAAGVRQGPLRGPAEGARPAACDRAVLALPCRRRGCAPGRQVDDDRERARRPLHGRHGYRLHPSRERAAQVHLRRGRCGGASVGGARGGRGRAARGGERQPPPRAHAWRAAARGAGPADARLCGPRRRPPGPPPPLPPHLAAPEAPHEAGGHEERHPAAAGPDQGASRRRAGAPQAPGLIPSPWLGSH
jgi:hypothetical protein